MSEAAGDGRPDPRAIHDCDDLLAAFRQLREWAGEPSLRQLTALAGQRRLPDGRTVDALPSSTLSDNLGGGRLPRVPRRSFVNAFVTACLRARHCPEAEIAAEVQRWRQALRRVTTSASTPQVPAAGVAPTPGGAAGAASRQETGAGPRDLPTPAAGPDFVWPPAPADQAQPFPATTTTSTTPVAPPAASSPVRHRAVRPAASRSRRRARVVAVMAGFVVLAAVIGFTFGTGVRDEPPSTATPLPRQLDVSSAPPAAETTPPGPLTPSPVPPAAAPAGRQETRQPAPATRRPSGSSRTLPRAGWYVVQPGHTRSRGFCWGVGQERNGRTTRPLVVQRSCGAAERTKVVPLGGGVYRLEWQSSQYGPHCLAVDYGDQATAPGALLAPRACSYGGNRFRLEPYGGGFRLRPTHSNLCVGSLNGARDTASGAEAMQSRCTGGADQWFAFTPRG